MKDPQRAGLIVNWIGSQCTMTLHSMGIMLDKPKTVFDALELQLSIVECKYPHNVSDQLLKDQYIFGICIKEIQGHLLGEITPKDNSEKCLLESCKIESKIKEEIAWNQDQYDL